MASPYEHDYAIRIKCIALGSGLGVGHSSTEHANKVAGTKGWPLVGALNRIAGNPPNKFRELEGVLNQLAGTKGLGTNAAASRWAGN